jgi:hypothetical protein
MRADIRPVRMPKLRVGRPDALRTLSPYEPYAHIAAQCCGHRPIPIVVSAWYATILPNYGRAEARA